MIRLPDRDLPENTHAMLKRWQQAIDAIDTYEERVESARRQFRACNVKGNDVFENVKHTLDAMCNGPRRCCYCEDSLADEVEHIKPKNLYPEEVFAWENYLYACGPCNAPKGSKFAVFTHSHGEIVEIQRRKGVPVVPPESGDPVLINPRRENPMEFLLLDILGTFQFVAGLGISDRDTQRARYTIKLLGLNGKNGALENARRSAYGSYRARLHEYIHKRNANALQDDLDECVEGIRTMAHPTVWKEMQRLHAKIPELKALFDQAPEALLW